MSDPQYVKPAEGVSIVASSEVGVDWSISSNSVKPFPSDPKQVKFVRRQLLRGRLVEATQQDYDDFTEQNPPYVPPPSGNVIALNDLSDVEADDAQPGEALVQDDDGIWRPTLIEVTAPVEPEILTFNYTGEVAEWVVPEGVTEVTMELWGAMGAGTSPGLGGRVKGTREVTPGETLEVRVGGQGVNDIGGWNGGGAGAGGANAGGGATDVRQGGSTYAHRVLVAAGGGGSSAGDKKGGDGGAAIGEQGMPQKQDTEGGGNGGTAAAGGAAHPSNSHAGSIGVGANADRAGCGGGGGGRYGGGSGGEWFDFRGAGGGGSNHAPDPGDESDRGGRADNGRVIFTYLPG